MTANASLRTMYAKARDASVPIDTIERAIKRGRASSRGSATSRCPTRATPRPVWR
jgi:transcriptional/translational regulatory protein YebC/TACO1